eukprot:2194717-Pyramimonas_sp.AAC.1
MCLAASKPISPFTSSRRLPPFSVHQRAVHRHVHERVLPEVELRFGPSWAHYAGLTFQDILDR